MFSNILSQFAAFHINAATNFAYLLTTNFWFIFLIVAVVGTVVLQLKEQVDTSIREEQNII